MIIIIVFLDFLYIFLLAGGRGRLVQFFLGLLAWSQVNVGIRGNISNVELGGRRELRHGRPHGAHGEVVAEAGGDGEVLLQGRAGLGQLEAGEDSLGGAGAGGTPAELRRENIRASQH